jgi:hypothetical protein
VAVDEWMKRGEGAIVDERMKRGEGLIVLGVEGLRGSDLS